MQVWQSFQESRSIAVYTPNRAAELAVDAIEDAVHQVQRAGRSVVDLLETAVKELEMVGERAALSVVRMPWVVEDWVSLVRTNQYTLAGLFLVVAFAFLPELLRLAALAASAGAPS